MLRVRPITIRLANAFIALHHRHHGPVPGARFCIGAFADDDGWEALVGVVIVSRPIARMLDPQKVAEVTRLATNGYPNACSLLYSAAARACRAMGFERIITFILEEENGASLKASNWQFSGMSDGGSWSRPSRKRGDDHPLQRKQRWELGLL